MAMIPRFSYNTLEKIADSLGNSLSHRELGACLTRLNIKDANSGASRQARLLAALVEQQNRDNCGNNVAAFIKEVMTPVRYVANIDRFNELRHDVNKILVFSGLELRDDGELIKAIAARTLDEAHNRANRLKEELLRRKVHSEVLKYCREELVQNNCFHAVFETTKGVAERLRTISDCVEDGSELVDKAFSLSNGGTPVIAINSLTTETERSEHKGFANLIRGLFGAFRNVTAHAPKILWTIDEREALDLLTFASLIHYKLDKAIRTRL